MLFLVDIFLSAMGGGGAVQNCAGLTGKTGLTGLIELTKTGTRFTGPCSRDASASKNQQINKSQHC